MAEAEIAWCNKNTAEQHAAVAAIDAQNAQEKSGAQEQAGKPACKPTNSSMPSRRMFTAAALQSARTSLKQQQQVDLQQQNKRLIDALAAAEHRADEAERTLAREKATSCKLRAALAVLIGPAATDEQPTATPPQIGFGIHDTPPAVSLDESSADRTVYRGSIRGALYVVVVPATPSWTGRVLVMAHGFRHPDIPLVADLPSTRTGSFYEETLNQGWIVANTSYSVRGGAVREGEQDVRMLLRFIEQQFGEVSMAVLEGRSMGGAIATKVAEAPEGFHGVLAIGAALSSGDGKAAATFNYNPQIPLLFLTPMNDASSAKHYVHNAAEADVLPGCWEIMRMGHNNVIQAEHAKAFSSLVLWIDTQCNATARNIQFVHSGAPPEALAQLTRSQSAKECMKALITSVGLWGTFQTTLRKEDLCTIGVNLGKEMWVKIGDLEAKHCACYSYHPHNNVKPGQLAGFEDPEGLISFCIPNRVGVAGACSGQVLPVDEFGVWAGQSVEVSSNEFKPKKLRFKGMPPLVH